MIINKTNSNNRIFMNNSLTRIREQQRQKIEKTSKEFEEIFIGQMLKPMFSAVQAEAPFSGGYSEEIWRGFMIDAIAKQMAQQGGLGLSDDIKRQLLSLQEVGQR